MHTNQTITQAEAARRLGVSPGHLGDLIRKGHLEAVETADGLRLIPLRAVAKFVKPARGRPRRVNP